ncbi:MAG: 16S rRNA (guanine(966)-N(2))-methyltransferase RsmD [Wenzhouxiangellaceae bacterium]|nr:16S rRNA (guanine(966)-N(2))-methyltransferase RsmD [Wenzhouxiangellaceae bacterium]
MTGSLRIIGGSWRGRRLAVPDLRDLRPSGDRVRETLFNWLQGRVHGRRCLDLFAGTGALGLEAASRGAAEVVLVERERKLVDALDRIATDWPGGEVLKPVRADALAWLETAAGPFDLVLADPPFAAGCYAQLLARLARPGLLAADARIYLESPARAAAPVASATSPPSSAPCMAAELEPDEPTWTILREKIAGEVRMQLLAAATEPRATG